MRDFARCVRPQNAFRRNQVLNEVSVVAEAYRELRFSWIPCRGVLWCASENWILEKGYLQLIRATFIKLR